jgi:hypothetical protein
MTSGFSRSRAVALAIALILPLRAVPALAQQETGSLFFLNSAYDKVAAGYIDQYGVFQQTYESGNWAGYTPSSGGTKVINTANGFLVYEPASGSARVVRINHDGQPSKGGKYWFSPWDQIVGSGTFLFFYNTNGSAAVGHITPAGAFVQTQGWSAGNFGYWTHVLATDNHLVFYNKNTGQTATGYITINGTWWYQTETNTTWHCDIVTSLGRFVLCYNSLNGQMEVIDFDRNGIPAPTQVVQMGGGYTQVVRHGRGVVFYASGSGGAEFGYVDSHGFYVTTQVTNILMDLYHFGVTADSVTSTGDALLFYNRQYGVAIAGTVDDAGQFQKTEETELAPWFSNVVATAAR